MNEEKRDIPSAIAREVRQRCGFGCVICGHPLYQYHHMKDWAVYKRHISHEITLLCYNHHIEATHKLLTEDEVNKADKHPFNIRNGISSPYNLRFSGKEATIFLGSIKTVLFTKDTVSQLVPFLFYDYTPLLINIIENKIFLNLEIINEFGRQVLLIEDNVLRYKSDVFDITFEGRTLTIRKELRQILLEIEFLPPNLILIKRWKMNYKDVKLTLNNHGMNVLRNGKGPFFRSPSSITFKRSGIIISCGESTSGAKGIFVIGD